MRGFELLEDQTEHDARIYIDKNILLLNNILIKFDTLVEAHGYDFAVKEANQAI